MLFRCFEAFLENILIELLFLVQKVTISEKSTEILRKLFYWERPEENLDLSKQLFLTKPVKIGEILTKTVFLHKVSHIQLNYAFLLF